MYHTEPIVRDIVKAIAWCKKAADAGNSNAMNNLGVLYKNEPSVKDIGKAIAWYEKAADAMVKLEFWHSLHELTALKDKTIRKQFGMIIL